MFKKFLIPVALIAGTGASYAFISGGNDTPGGHTEKQSAVQAGAPVKAAAITYNKSKVEEILLTLGYTDIAFRNATPPNYQVQACQSGQKFNLTVNEWAEIVSTKAVGACTGGQTFAQRELTFDDLGSFPDTPEDGSDFADNGDVTAPNGRVRSSSGSKRHAGKPRSRSKGITVNAPTTRVQVTKRRIVVRAPFVNINIPR